MPAGLSIGGSPKCDVVPEVSGMAKSVDVPSAVSSFTNVYNPQTSAPNCGIKPNTTRIAERLDGEGFAISLAAGSSIYSAYISMDDALKLQKFLNRKRRPTIMGRFMSYWKNNVEVA
jgi:hypothetical protein